MLSAYMAVKRKERDPRPGHPSQTARIRTPLTRERLNPMALRTIIYPALTLLGIWLCPPTPPEPQLAAAKIHQDQAGPYVITNSDINTGKDRKKNAEIRSFIWEHWREKKPGRLVVKRYSKEGIPGTSTIVLDPDGKGAWSMRVSTHWPPTKGSTPEHDQSEYRVYVVRRIEPRHDGQSPATFIQDEAIRLGDTYWLVFYDEKGRETGGE